MGHVEFSSQSYMRTYLAEMLLKADKLHVSEKVSSNCLESQVE